jgi:hypothetical protein
MFQLTAKKTSHLKSQFVISSQQSIGDQSVSMNWSQFVTSSRKHRGLAYRPYSKFAELEKRVGKQGVEIGAIIDAIRQLMAPPEKPRREIGFHVREKAPRYRSRNHR